MPNSGYYTWSLDGQSGLRCRSDDAHIMHPLCFLSNGGTSPWKSTAPRNCWIKSVPVLSLPKGCHPPQTLFLSHRAGLSSEAARGHLLMPTPLLTPSAYLDRPGLSRDHSYLTCGLLHRTSTSHHTSKISSSTGVRTSYPSSVTTTVFSTPTAPSPGKTTLGSREKTIPTSKG